MTEPNVRELFDHFPRAGRVRWIGLRPARGAAPLQPQAAHIQATGLEGDRYAGRSGRRAVTLLQWEHLSVVAALLGVEEVDPAILRRNIALSDINALALRDRRFQIGAAVLRGTGACHPCSKMERALGPGGFNALRGHGGITAEVLQPGRVAVGDGVTVLAG